LTFSFKIAGTSSSSDCSSSSAWSSGASSVASSSASVSSTGATLQLTSPTAAGYPSDGEVFALNSSGTYLAPGTTAVDSPFITMGYRTGNSLFLSNRIFGKGVKKASATSASQGREQIYHIGYTGSGSQNIDVTAANDFYAHVTYTYDSEMWSEQQNRRSYFNTYITPTAKKVALDTAKSINDDPGTAVEAEVLCDGTATVIGAGVTVQVIKGSKTIVFSTASHNLIVGDLVRIGVTGSGVGTNIPVYEVKAVNSATVTLNMAYQGANAAALDANVSVGEITTAATVYGIRVTGVPLDYRKDVIPLLRVTFKLGLTGFGDTVITKTQEASMGNGDGRIVADLESFAQGFDGVLDRMSNIRPDLRTDAVRTTTAALSTANGNDLVNATTIYDSISLTFGQEASNGFLTAPTQSFEDLQIFFVDGAAQEAGVLNQINPWLDSLGFNPLSL